MAYKFLAFSLLSFGAAMLISTSSAGAAEVVDEFSPRFTNQAPVAFGDDIVNPRDLIAQHDDDALLAEELNAIMPAAGAPSTAVNNDAGVEQGAGAQPATPASTPVQ